MSETVGVPNMLEGHGCLAFRVSRDRGETVELDMDDGGPFGGGEYVLDRAESPVAVAVVVGDVEGMRTFSVDVVGGNYEWMTD